MAVMFKAGPRVPLPASTQADRQFAEFSLDAVRAVAYSSHAEAVFPVKAR
jgi:hypothetical protein